MNDELKIFLKKTSLLFCLTLLPLIVGKLLIPLDWYSFRCWETLLDPHTCSVHKSFFYANASCSRTEVGDLGAHSRYAVKKVVNWHTDAQGLRNNNDTPNKKYPIVIVGDSDIVGTSLSEDATLTAVVEKLTGASTYAWAPHNMNDFLNSPRFQKTPPSFVVSAENERTIALWPAILKLQINKRLIDELIKRAAPLKQKTLGCAAYEKLPEKWQRYWSDVLKKPFLIPYLAKIGWSYLFSKGSESSFVSNDGKFLFFKYALGAVQDLKRQPTNSLQRIAKTILTYNQLLRNRGMVMIYMPIPTKESVYWEKIPSNLKEDPQAPSHLSRLVALVESQGIPAIDLTSFFRQEINLSGKQLYQSDDCHLNANGAKFAAYILAQKILQLHSMQK